MVPGLQPDAQEVGGRKFETTGEGHHGGDVELAHDFLEILGGKTSSRTPLEAGISSAQMCLLAREACQTNQYQEIRSG